MNQDKLQLVIRNLSEVVTEEELIKLLETNPGPKAYVGFEPSGLMHIGSGVILANKINDLMDAGFDFTILIADWHAYINDKMGGKIDDIALCGEYVRDCFLALGVDESKVKFELADVLIQRKEYWEKVLKISKSSSIARIKRAITIMGRSEEEAELDASKLIYPAMQVADIFEMDIDVALGGMDQRHAHMLARDISSKLGWKKVVAIHTPIMAGLQGGGRMEFDAKMSKSKPQTCIFIHDTPEDIKSKIAKAFCPPDQIDGNPIVEIWKYIIFNDHDEVTIERAETHGGTLRFKSFEELSKTFTSGGLHPQDLKAATTKYLIEMLEPVRKYFESKPQNYSRVLELIQES
jgi:tyrosyl-tRNA synthetase